MQRSLMARTGLESMNVDGCVTLGFLSLRRLEAHAKINLAGDAGISDSFSPDCQLLSHHASPLFFSDT